MMTMVVNGRVPLEKSSMWGCFSILWFLGFAVHIWGPLIWRLSNQPIPELGVLPGLPPGNPEQHRGSRRKLILGRGHVSVSVCPYACRLPVCMRRQTHCYNIPICPDEAAELLEQSLKNSVACTEGWRLKPFTAILLGRQLAV